MTFSFFRRRAWGGVAYKGRASTTGWRFLGSRGPCEQINNPYRFTDQWESGQYTSKYLPLFLVPIGWQEEDSAVFLSTLTRTQAAAVQLRVSSYQQTLLRRRNRQHFPDVRDIFRPHEKVIRWTSQQHDKHARNLKIKTLEKVTIFSLPLYCSFWSWAFIHIYSILVRSFCRQFSDFTYLFFLT